MTGRIHSFQSLGTVDGPGVRSVVFLQGCPLRCVCCHNPDTWDPAGGEETDTGTLIRKILRFRAYFGEKGGVTVSGGEPLLQAEFVTELFSGLKQAGVRTALDTSGYRCDEKAFALLGVTDLVLLDHKYPTEEAYFRNTGCRLSAAERFLAEAQARGVPVWLRRVVIPGLTDGEDAVKQLVGVAEAFPCVERIELLPFRKLCVEKYDRMGIPFPLASTPVPSRETMSRLNALLPEKYR